MIKTLLLPTMETAPADRAAAAAESLAAELGERLRSPLPSITRITGDMEKNSPLFCGSSANPQQSMFGPPADGPPAELAVADALPSSFDGFPRRHGSVNIPGGCISKAPAN